jgi:hypothetical protein
MIATLGQAMLRERWVNKPRTFFPLKKRRTGRVEKSVEESLRSIVCESQTLGS